MVEIKTQEQFNNINNIISNLTTDGELIRIHELPDNNCYILSSSIIIKNNNVTIEGYGVSKPKIKSSITNTDLILGNMINVIGIENNELMNIIIDNLNLIGNNTLGQYGIYCSYVGKNFSSGLEAGDYSRYNSSTNGISKICKNGITIKNCYIQNNNSTGIVIEICSNSIIDNNLVINNNYGIDNLFATNNIISNNTISNNKQKGICFSINCTMNKIVTNNIINNVDTGISLFSSNNNTISNNNINNNKDGINGTNVISLIIINNIIQNNIYGITLETSFNNSISNNSISNNKLDGIHISNTTKCIISNNNIELNAINGINFINKSGTNIVTSNTISKNNNGILAIDVLNTLLCSNICVENTGQNYSITGVNNQYNQSYNI